jgi:hypothetical protein
MYKNQRKYNIKINWQAIALSLYCPHLSNMQYLEKLKIEYHLTNTKTDIKEIKTKLRVLYLYYKIEKLTLLLSLYSSIKSHSKRHTFTHQIRPT